MQLEQRILEQPLQRAAQTARLRWQLKFDELLLAERVLDALVVFQRLNFFPLPVVHIFPASSAFPWKVVLETDFPEEFQNWLTSLRDWLAIRVDVRPARQVRPLGHCVEPFGKEGVAGGMFIPAGGLRPYPYRVTCSHVVAPNCAYVELRSNGEGDQAPDVALIREISPCFNDEPLSNFSRSFPATGNQLEQFILAKARVTMKRGQNQKIGYIASRVAGFPVGNRYYRFPHCTVLPYIPRILLAIPFGRRPFSHPGDSGSWLFEEANGIWIGMLVAGDRSFLYSYVTEPEPLLDYCRDGLRNHDRNIDFAPFVLGRQ
jgi:hypothetical protein